MKIDVKICFAYKHNREQAEQCKSCKELTDSVISLLIEQGRIGIKTEFSNLSSEIKPCTEISEADFIIGDPSHPNFQVSYASEEQSILRPVPAVILLSDDTWGDAVNSVLKNPLQYSRNIQGLETVS